MTATNTALEALKIQIVEALAEAVGISEERAEYALNYALTNIDGFRSALSDPTTADQEPVAWLIKDHVDGWAVFDIDPRKVSHVYAGAEVQPLYGHPQPDRVVELEAENARLKEALASAELPLVVIDKVGGQPFRLDSSMIGEIKSVLKLISAALKGGA